MNRKVKIYLSETFLSILQFGAKGWVQVGRKPATHLANTTKDQYGTKIESHIGSDLASQHWGKKLTWRSHLMQKKYLYVRGNILGRS